MFKQVAKFLLPVGITFILVINSFNSASGATSQTTLTKTMKNQLIYLAQEEKLAHDLYVAVYQEIGIRQFANISQSETQHTSTVEYLLEKYKIKNPNDSLDFGEFSNPELQKVYDQLLASVEDYNSALQVGVSVEKLDISDLNKILEKVMPADVRTALKNLRSASYNHLAAFSR